MKKRLHLTIAIGLPLFLFIAVFSYAQASTINLDNLNKNGSNTEPEQVGPRWYNGAWHYRRPILISNDGGYLPYYQILIKLDNSNFDFNKVNDDGSDVRFTDSSGINSISYWIESWDSVNELAYLWVLVSSLPPEPYDTTIYLYYGNPAAVSAASGIDTFDFFDDFWEFGGVPCSLNISDLDVPHLDQGWNQQEGMDFINTDKILEGSWCVINGSPTVSGGIINIPTGTGIRTNNPFLYEAVGFKANYGLGAGKEWAGFINGATGQRTIIGDLPDDVDDQHLIDFVSSFDKVILPRVGGMKWHGSYHTYEIRWNSGKSMGDIDHGDSTAFSTVPAQVPNITLPVTLYSYMDSNATLRVDWVYVRQYRESEPNTILGDEQGLVELGISNIDSPDPLRPGAILTYQLTISNTSTINAPGVVVTDTLPGNILLGSVSPSQGNCVPINPIHCDLNMIPANSMATITIIGTPSSGGVITNTAVVGSPGYELDRGNNIREQPTLVDSIAPDVNWEKPVHNGQDYITYGGLVGLEASATDNDQVNWVQFYLWDHINNKLIYYDPDYSYPYQMKFDSDDLVVDEIYQLLVHGSDRVGNISDPRIIWIRRTSVFLEYLAIITK